MAACGAGATARQDKANRRADTGVRGESGIDSPRCGVRAQTARVGLEARSQFQIDYRWKIGDVEKARTATADLLKSAPDVLLAVASPATATMQQTTRTIPIVFVAVSEPVAQGFVASLAHPGGNMTGFTHLEPTLGAKWLELLKEIAPRLSRVALMFNAAAGQRDQHLVNLI